METLIRLMPDPRDPTRDVLVGIHEETEIDDKVIASVQACRRLFHYVVPQIAANRMREQDPNFVYNPQQPATGRMLDLMGVVRDELAGYLG